MSLPRYREYKESGVEWLGTVPSHWALPRLKHIAKFSGGGTPSRDIADYWNGEIPWVSPKDMKCEIINATEESITPAGLNGSTSKLIAPGHVLMVVRSGILKHTIPVAINKVAVALNQDMKALDFDSAKCESAYFFRWVQGLNDDLLLAWAKQGATVESIEHAYLANTVIPLPPIAEQRSITAFLDREIGKIDALIAEQEKLIALLAEKRQAAISHAVTRGLNPDLPMKDSGIAWLGKVPANWATVAIKRLGDIRYGLGEPPIYQPEGTALVRATNIHAGKIFREGLVFVNPADIPGQRIVWLKEGDIIVVRSGAYTGDSGLIDSEYDGAIAGFDMVLRLHSCAPRFVQYALLSSYLKNFQIELSSMRAAQPHLNAEELGACLMVLPPADEQLRIVAFLDAEITKLDSLKAEAERVIALFAERRSALIAAAVSGQIDVRREVPRQVATLEGVAA